MKKIKQRDAQKFNRILFSLNQLGTESIENATEETAKKVIKMLKQHKKTAEKLTTIPEIDLFIEIIDDFISVYTAILDGKYKKSYELQNMANRKARELMRRWKFGV